MTTVSRIRGSSRGFEGRSLFELENGQIWQQVEYYYHYRYAYRPEVVIRTGMAATISIDGIDRTVRVRRIR